MTDWVAGTETVRTIVCAGVMVDDEVIKIAAFAAAAAALVVPITVVGVAMGLASAVAEAVA
jgi:hypothetical protein